MNKLLPRNDEKGFTLAELSIVLVIIGLLIGGTLVAQNLITTAERNSFIKQIQSYDIIISTFKQKFKQIPGDSSYFSPAGDNNTYMTTAGTCTPASGGWVNCAAGVAGEVASTWTHLFQAGLLNRNYSVSWWSANFETTWKPADFFPLSKIGIKNTTINFGTNVTNGVFPSTEISYFIDKRQTGMMQGETVISAKDVYAIDQKIDDGVSNTGNVRASGNLGIHSLPSTGANGCIVDTVSYAYNFDSTAATPCNIDILVMGSQGIKLN